MTIGTQTEDSIFEVMKEGEMDMLDNVWKQVRNNRSLSKLREELGFWKAMTQVAQAIGEEPLEFEDHTPFSNRGMKDLLEIDELVSTIRTEVIPPRSTKPLKPALPLC